MSIQPPLTWVERTLSTMKARNISRTTVIQRLGIGHSTFSLWMSKNRKPQDLSQLVLLASILGVDPAWLVFGVESELTSEETRVIREMRADPACRQRVTAAVTALRLRRPNY